MKKSRARTTLICSIVLVVCLGGSMLFLRPLDKARADSSLEDVLYIPSARVLKSMSFGYSGLMADMYWLRTVQYFGSKHHQRAKKYDLLYPLLDITITLDPHLIEAGQFGSIFLSQKPPEGAGQPDKAVEIVTRCIDANPEDWQLYYNLGFIYYGMQDYASASRAFKSGSQIPGAHPYLKALAAATAEKGGSPETAHLIWTEIYETSTSAAVRKTAIQHLIALQIDSDIPQLEALVREYNDRMGHPPTNFSEMVAAGWLKALPTDPTGDRYILLSDGRVVIKSPDSKPFVNNGLPDNH